MKNSKLTLVSLSALIPNLKKKKQMLTPNFLNFNDERKKHNK